MLALPCPLKIKLARPVWQRSNPGSILHPNLITGFANICQILSGPHLIQVKIRPDTKQLQHLVQHFPMLGSHANLAVDLRMLGQRLNQGSHLDCFRAGTKHS